MVRRNNGPGNSCYFEKPRVTLLTSLYSEITLKKLGKDSPFDTRRRYPETSLRCLMSPVRKVAAALACALLLCVVIVGIQLMASSLRGHSPPAEQALGTSEPSDGSTLSANPTGEADLLPQGGGSGLETDSLTSGTSLSPWSSGIDSVSSRIVVEDLNAESKAAADAALQLSPLAPQSLIDNSTSPLPAQNFEVPRR
jgi:hypothetical protein